MTYGGLQAATEAALCEGAASTVLTDYVDVEKWAREIVNTRRPPDQSDLTAVWSACRRKDTR